MNLASSSLLSSTMWPGAATGETFSQPAVSLDQIQNDPDKAWMRNWQVTGLLNWEDKNGDGLIQYYNDTATTGPAAEMAASQNLQGNELTTVNNDIMVLANPEIANLPGWVIAIVAAIAASYLWWDYRGVANRTGNPNTVDLIMAGIGLILLLEAARRSLGIPLMALGMMMLSPTIISMPFKLLLFVLVDGWALTMGSLAGSFAT